MKKIIAVVLTIFCGLFLVGCGGGLNAEDEKAYDYIAQASGGFKDPSSVRILGGGFWSGSDDDVLCAQVSAANGYGARTNSYYFIYADGTASEVEAKTVEYALSSEEGKEIVGDNYDAFASFVLTDALNYDAINEKLDEKWKSFN